MIKIKKVQNGYMVINGAETIVFQDTIDNHIEVDKDSIEIEEKKALGALLEYIAHEMGYTYNKFGKDNLDINFKKEGYKI